MCHNLFQVYKSKAEVIIFGSKEEQSRVSAQHQLLYLEATDQGQNLGAMMNSDMNLQRSLKTIAKSSYNLKNVSRVRGLMSQKDLDKLIHMFIHKLSPKNESDSRSWSTILIKLGKYSKSPQL